MKRHRFVRLTALVEESDALARIVAKDPSAPVSLLRDWSRSDMTKRLGKTRVLNHVYSVCRIVRT